MANTQIDSKYLEQVYAPLNDRQKQLILVKNNISGYFFDAVFRVTHQNSLTVTSHPVQTGANISDHAYINPTTVTMDIGMSDVVNTVLERYLPTDQFSGDVKLNTFANMAIGRVSSIISNGLPAFVSNYSVISNVINNQIRNNFNLAPLPSRSVKAYNVLLQLQKSRLPLQIVTRQAIYKNMVIENIDSTDDFKTLYGLRATVTFKEIFVVQVTQQTVSARPQTTNSTSKGNIQPTEPPASLIVQWGLDKAAQR